MIDSNEKAAMAAAIRAMGSYSASPQEIASPNEVPSHLLGGLPPVSAITEMVQPIERAPLPDVDDKTAMKDILTRFYSAADTVTDAISIRATVDRELGNALVTEKTDRGARVGSWEIVKHSDMYFDVVHFATNEPIASGLMLYEAAYALVTSLNAGKTINDPVVKQIIRLEEQYVHARQKAMHYKRTREVHIKEGNTSKAVIAEDRLLDARVKALGEHERILQLAGLL